MGKSTISMAIFNSFLLCLPEGKHHFFTFFNITFLSVFCQELSAVSSRSLQTNRIKKTQVLPGDRREFPPPAWHWMPGWNMDETNGWNQSIFWKVVGDSQLYFQVFSKFAATTSTVDSFNNISCGLTVDSFSMSPWTKWWFSRGSIKTLSSDASFVDGLAPIMKSGKNGVESSDWPVVFDVKSCGSSSPSLRWEQTKGETVKPSQSVSWIHLISIHSHKSTQ